MKRILSTVFLVLSLLILSNPNQALAATNYSAGASNPATVLFWGANVWSSPAYWDLTNITDIPDGATIYSIRENYSQNYSYTDLKVALFNGSGSGYYIKSGIGVTGFVGQLVKQNWSTQCYAKYQGWITPVLNVSWNAPATATVPALTGVTTLLSDGSTETVILNDEHVPATLAIPVSNGTMETSISIDEAINKTLNNSK